MFPILIDAARAGLTRDAFLDALHARKLGAGVHYLSIAEHPYYQRTFGWRPEDWPNAMRIGRQTLSLALSPRLTDDRRDRRNLDSVVPGDLERRHHVTVVAIDGDEGTGIEQVSHAASTDRRGGE